MPTGNGSSPAVGEVTESKGVPAECFESAVYGLGGAVGGMVVKERQDVGAAAP